MKKSTLILMAIIGFSTLFIAAKKSKTVVFSLKNIEKTFAKVDSNLYACKYEVNNVSYQAFLKDLKIQGKSELIKLAEIDTARWISESQFNEPLQDYYHKHPAYANYPVVNISYEGAQLFCKWLTEKYNQNPKRKFKKVLIRLPNKEEWQKTALGTLSHVPYPWGGPDVTGHCNFHKVPQASIHFDKEKNEYILPKTSNMGVAGAISDDYSSTAPVDSYEANSIGLYNMSGNVQEMIQEKGIACGGGWRSAGYDVQIISTAKYEHANIDLGFRYFIEVITD